MASVTLESVFVTSSDGTRLAVDVWLPPGVTLTGS
jgi:predicted acyl esterase